MKVLEADYDPETGGVRVSVKCGTPGFAVAAALCAAYIAVGGTLEQLAELFANASVTSTEAAVKLTESPDA